jgi:hypothetical protein
MHSKTKYELKASVEVQPQQQRVQVSQGKVKKVKNVLPRKDQRVVERR